MTQFVELVLTCASWQEAQRIADSLLEKHLVVCVEFFEVKSQYHWRGKIDEADEIKLVMKTMAEHFDSIEAEVNKLHSYDVPVLEQIPIERVSAKAAEWWRDETKQG